MVNKLLRREVPTKSKSPKRRFFLRQWVDGQVTFLKLFRGVGGGRGGEGGRGCFYDLGGHNFSGNKKVSKKTAGGGRRTPGKRREKRPKEEFTKNGRKLQCIWYRQEEEVGRKPGFFVMSINKCLAFLSIVIDHKYLLWVGFASSKKKMTIWFVSLTTVAQHRFVLHWIGQKCGRQEQQAAHHEDPFDILMIIPKSLNVSSMAFFISSPFL